MLRVGEVLIGRGLGHERNDHAQRNDLMYLTLACALGLAVSGGLSVVLGCVGRESVFYGKSSICDGKIHLT